MAPYTPLSILRSDGVAEYIFNGVNTLNQPKPEDLDPTPNAQGQISVYKRVAPDEMKDLQWRRKLAGMLIELLGGTKHKNKDCILSAFPQDFVLWQQLKYTDGPSATTSTKKSHATAGAERNDAYLFGHPGGRSKKYRSPQEFFPHLLWLATDKDGDPLNCSCKHCAPERRGSSNADHDVNIAEVSPPVKEEEPKAVAPKVVQTSVSTAPSNTTFQTSVPGSYQPRPISMPKPSAEQEFDGRVSFSGFIYRPGELVWFNKGTAWGLAVVCSRQMQDQSPRYLLQPLSNPLQLEQAQVRGHDKMRPWLAWSVPATTHSRLENMAFDQVPWDKVVKGEFREPGRPGDAIVDGSILAAKAIDTSYSLFDRLNIPTAAGEAHYAGMFLGGEKVWIQEPVRLATPPGSSADEVVVLIVEKLIERTAGSNSTLTVVGDVFKFVEMPNSDRSTAANDTPNQKLPARMVADIAWRNQVAAAVGRGTWSEWRLVEPAARKTLKDIRGRWYESACLLETLKGSDKVQKDIRLGIVQDTSVLMNGRMEGRTDGPARKKNRLDSLGRSVPAGLKISRGLNGPVEERTFLPAGGQVNQQDMPQFMDLDVAGEQQGW